MLNYNEAKVNQKVQYKGNSTIGQCTGIIVKLYPPDMLDAPFDYGHACVRLDELPSPWPYSSNDFVPSLADVELIDVPKNN